MSFVENRTGSKTKRLVSLLQKGMLLLITVGILVTIFDLLTFKGHRSEHLQIATESHRWKRLSDTCSGKEPLLELVSQAVGNVSTAQAYIQDNCRALPTWKGVSNLYGPTPVILGLEHCEDFRSNLNQAKPLGGLKIAGFFNSGTNAMARTLMENLNDGKYGSRATLESTLRAQGLVTQVPWGKHRWILADELARLSQPDILPVVVVRDPYRWMQSMCKSRYTLVWDRGLANHCPNLVPSNNKEMEMNGNRSSFSVQLTQSVTSTHHSLASLWSSWYGSYFRSSAPRLIVRMEDLVFHGPELVRRLSDCVGIDRVQPFVFLTEAAKDHGRSTDLLTAIVKYGSSEGRYSGMMVQDLVYARDALSADLMETLHYQYDSV